MSLVFSTHPLHPEAEARLDALGEFRVASAPTPAAILAESRGAALIVVRAPIPSEVAARPGLRAFLRHGAGLDMVPVGAATDAGVLVTNAPGANAVTVAEHAIWSAMALLRRHPAVAADLKGRGWEVARAHADGTREMTGRSLAVVGLGAVGCEVARIARTGFGMSVRAVTGRADLPQGVARASLLEALAASDVVVLCCPLTEHTRGLVGAAELVAIRDGAVLVNVARGPVVVEAALLEALRSGRLSAALDVFDAQPLPPGHPLLALPNVILTPHMAGITEDSMARLGVMVAAEARAILAGGRPPNLRNPEVWPAYAARWGLATAL